VRRLVFVAPLVAICLPGLLGANAWLENSDVDRYVEMIRGEVGEVPFCYRPAVPWLASLLAFPAVTSLRLVSLVCTLGAYLCIDRIVALTGPRPMRPRGDRSEPVADRRPASAGRSDGPHASRPRARRRHHPAEPERVACGPPPDPRARH